MFFRRRGKRALRALQVEVTSRCTRTCLLCPRSILFDRWQDSDLSGELWARLLPDLKMAEHVHLQGWGEPLLHPELRRMVHDCRTSGCSVGITTNGDLFESALDWIVDEEVDLVTVSVAGGPATQARLRGGSRLESVISAAGEIALLSRQRGGKIWVQLSYLLTRENARELPTLVEKAARARIAEVFVIHLDCTPSSQLLQMSAFDDNGLARGVREHLDVAGQVARQHGVRFRAPCLYPRELLACALDPLRFAFITSQGRVGPCVYELLPVSGPIPRWSHTGEHEVEPVCYGLLQDAGLKEILDGQTRGAFVLPFKNRYKAEDKFNSSVSMGFGTEALRELEEAEQERARAFAENPFPRTCEGCHKAQGW